MIIKNYLPNSFGYTDQSSLIKFPIVDFNPKLPEIIRTSPFPEIPGSLPNLPDIPKLGTWPDLPEITRTLPSVLPNVPEYPREWEFNPKDHEAESFLTRTITDPINNWLKGITKLDVIKFFLENTYDTIKDILDNLKEIEKELAGINPNQIFYNTPASDNFNGGIGLDTVVYTGNHNDYQISATQDILGNNTGYIVVENSGVVDTLIDIEQLEFADGHSSLGIIGSSITFEPLV